MPGNVCLETRQPPSFRHNNNREVMTLNDGAVIITTSCCSGVVVNGYANINKCECIVYDVQCIMYIV